MPNIAGKSLLALRCDAYDAVLGERPILGIVKRAAGRSGLEAPVSPHWLRPALDRGATIPEVRLDVETDDAFRHLRRNKGLAGDRQRLKCF
jgi:hypothetical protein